MPPKRKLAKASAKRAAIATKSAAADDAQEPTPPAPTRGRRKASVPVPAPGQPDPASTDDDDDDDVDVDEDARPGPAKRKRAAEKPPSRARANGKAAKATNGSGAKSQHDLDPIDEEHPVASSRDRGVGPDSAVNLVADWGCAYPQIRDGQGLSTANMDVDDDSVPPTAPTDLLLHQADLPCSTLLTIPSTSLDKSGVYIGSPLASLHEFTRIELEPVTVITRHAFSLLGFQAQHPPPIARLASSAPSPTYSNIQPAAPTNPARECRIYRLPNPETMSWATVDEVLETDPEIFSRIVQKDNRSQLPITRRIVCATRWVLPAAENAGKGKASKGKGKAKAAGPAIAPSMFVDPLAVTDPSDAWPLFTGVTLDMLPYLRVVLRPIPGESYAPAKDAEYMYRWTVYLRTDVVNQAVEQADPAKLATVRELLAVFPQAFQSDMHLVDQAQRLLAPVPVPSIDLSISPPQASLPVIHALGHHVHLPLLPAQERMLHWLLERELHSDSMLVHAYRNSSAAGPLEAALTHSSPPIPTVYQLGTSGAFYCPTTAQIANSSSDPSSIATSPELVPYHSLSSIVADQGDTRGLISVLLALIQCNPSVFPASMDMLPEDRGQGSIHTRATLVLAPALLIAHWHAVLGSHPSLRSLRTCVISLLSPEGRFDPNTAPDLEALDLVFATIDSGGFASSDEVRANRWRFNMHVSVTGIQWHRVIVPFDAYLPAEKVTVSEDWRTTVVREVPFLSQLKVDTSVVVTVALAPSVLPVAPTAHDAADVWDMAAHRPAAAMIEPTRLVHALADSALRVDAHLGSVMDGPLANRKGLMTLCTNLSLARIVLGSSILALPALELPMFTYTDADDDGGGAGDQADGQADMVPAIQFATVPVYESVAATLARSFLTSFESRSWSQMTRIAGAQHLSLGLESLEYKDKGAFAATMEPAAALPGAESLEQALAAFPAPIDFDQEWQVCKVFDVGLAHWLLKTVHRQMISSNHWSQTNKPLITLCSSVLRLFSTKQSFKSHQTLVQRVLARLGMPVDLIADVFGDLTADEVGVDVHEEGDAHGICYELDQAAPSTFRTRAKEAGVHSTGTQGAPHVTTQVLLRMAKVHASRAAALRYVGQIEAASEYIKGEYVVDDGDEEHAQVKCGECGMEAALVEDKFSVFACGRILCAECVDAHDCAAVAKCARKFEYPISQGQPAHIYPVGFRQSLARWKSFVASAKFDESTTFGSLIPRFPIPFLAFVGSKLAQVAMYISSMASSHSNAARFLVVATSLTTRLLVTDLLKALSIRTVNVDSTKKPESVFALDHDKSVQVLVMDIEECASAGIPQVQANHVVFLDTLGSTADVNDCACSDVYGEPFTRHSPSGKELDVMVSRLKEVEQRCIGTVYCAEQTQPVSVVRFVVRGSAEEEFSQRMWKVGQGNSDVSG